MARRPSGAVASMLEKDGTKKTIFFDVFTPAPRISGVQPRTAHKHTQWIFLDCQGHVMGLQKPTPWSHFGKPELFTND